MSTLKKQKIVISGYYGYDNCGDEAVLLSIIHSLKSLCPSAQITVLSGNPKKTQELYSVDALNRWNLPAIALRLLSARLLISGGGSLIQDVTSARSSMYYLGIIRLALFLKTKVMVYAQGVGPLISEKVRADTAKVFSRCHAITLRDGASAQLLKELGVAGDMQVACDPVMTLTLDDVPTDTLNKLKLEFGLADRSEEKRKPLLFVSVRYWKDNEFFSPVAEFLDRQSEDGWYIILVPAHFPQDVEAGRFLSTKMSSHPKLIERCLNAEEFIALTAIADRVFSMRLHGLICAAAVGTPMIGLSYDPKVDAFMGKLGMDDFCLQYDSFTSDAAESLFKQMPHKLSPDSHGDEPDNSVSPYISDMRKLAWEPANTAINLLK